MIKLKLLFYFSSVVSIGNNAFYGCQKLEILTFPTNSKSLKTIIPPH